MGAEMADEVLRWQQRWQTIRDVIDDVREGAADVTDRADVSDGVTDRADVTGVQG